MIMRKDEVERKVMRRRMVGEREREEDGRRGHRRKAKRGVAWKRRKNTRGRVSGRKKKREIFSNGKKKRERKEGWEDVLFWKGKWKRDGDEPENLGPSWQSQCRRKSMSCAFSSEACRGKREINTSTCGQNAIKERGR